MDPQLPLLHVGLKINSYRYNIKLTLILGTVTFYGGKGVTVTILQLFHWASPAFPSDDVEKKARKKPWARNADIFMSLHWG